MDEARPSRTALGVAMRRALHQVRDRPLVLDDPLAVPLVRGYAERWAELLAAADEPWGLGMRAHVVGRSRLAEDALAAAVGRGVKQYVLLGAGLDTFGYRNPHTGVRVFEVDHPATQRWKRELLGRAGVEAPESVQYVAVDFERQSLAEELVRTGFVREEPAVFAWLGVVPYLTREAFRGTLGFVAGCAAGSGVVMDYGQPREALTAEQRVAHDALAARVAAAGEPFRLYLTPGEMREEMWGFREVEDLGAEEMNRRYFGEGVLRARGAARFVVGWV